MIFVSQTGKNLNFFPFEISKKGNVCNFQSLNFTKTKILLNNHSTVWKSTIKRYHAQKFPWNQFLVSSLMLIWRKNVDFSVKIVIAFYSNFSHCEFFVKSKINHWKYPNLFSRNFWQNCLRVNSNSTVQCAYFPWKRFDGTFLSE